MWKNKIIEYIIKREDAVKLPHHASSTIPIQNDIAAYFPTMSLGEVKKMIIDSLAHYCVKCDQGYKTRGARNNHIRLKHKNG